MSGQNSGMYYDDWLSVPMIRALFRFFIRLVFPYVFNDLADKPFESRIETLDLVKKNLPDFKMDWPNRYEKMAVRGVLSRRAYSRMRIKSE